MKLKYYLRGMGIGILITTLLFMILITIHKNDVKQQDTSEKNMESTTVAAAKEDSTQQSERKDASSSESSENETENRKEQKEPVLPEQTEEPASETEEPTEQAEEASEEPQTPEEAQTGSPDDKVRLEIRGGEYSDVVCRRLAEAGLVDSAQSFNQFLVEKDYDNSILPGVYDIPKDSTYEEIAVLLTTKVDAP